MSTVRFSDVSRLIATLAAALALSAACVGSAVSPAGATPPSTAQLA
jgi:hypothetical protein